jgi:hypothetical protein
MKKRFLRTGVLLVSVIFTMTGCLEIIQTNLFGALERPDLSADHLNSLDQTGILETAEVVNDGGDADTYTDQEIGNLTGKLDQIIIDSSSNDVDQAASGWAGNIVLTAGGGNEVINGFMGVIPSLQKAGASATMQTLMNALKTSFGNGIGETEFLKKMKSILHAADYYSDLAGYITVNGNKISSDLKAGEIAQFGAFSLILKDAVIDESDAGLQNLYTALYTGDETALGLLIDKTAFDFDNEIPDTLDSDASTILTATGFMDLVR